MRTFSHHSGPVTGLEVDEEGALIFTCSEDGTVQILDVESMTKFYK